MEQFGKCTSVLLYPEFSWMGILELSAACGAEAWQRAAALLCFCEWLCCVRTAASETRGFINEVTQTQWSQALRLLHRVHLNPNPTKVFQPSTQVSLTPEHCTCFTKKQCVFNIRNSTSLSSESDGGDSASPSFVFNSFWWSFWLRACGSGQKAFTNTFRLNARQRKLKIEQVLKRDKGFTNWRLEQE